MPKGKSVYDTYFEAGASMGDYSSSLQKVADVWSNVDFSREKSAWETEKRERNLDTLLAATELVATVGGSRVGFKEGSTALSTKTGIDEPLKIGRGGKPWEELSKFEKLWQSPRYQFGEDVVMSGSEIRKYGRDVKEYGKFGVDLPVDIYKSMHEEYREGFERPEGDWYPGKYAKGALGVAEKVGQTIIPGGETGYKDLYSGVGKKLKAGPAATVPKLQTPTTQQTLDLSMPYALSVDPKDTSGAVLPTVEKEDYQYNPTGVGSKEWFEGSLKTFRQRDRIPSYVGSLKKYNPQLEILAKEQGWTGRRWE